MSDPFGVNEGVKTLTGSLDASRESAKSITKSIEGIQQDGASVAQQKAAERRKAQQYRPDTTVTKALKEYELVQEVKRMEVRMKAEVINKYGPKAWDDIQVIKQRMIKQEAQNKKMFDSDMKAVRRVQIYCFLVAAVISYFIVWGDK
jgi:23S rRNA maturation-related 3'-5' exoribonuclease YhaM